MRKKEKEIENKNEKKNNIFLLILFLIIILIVLFLPNIYNYIETLKLPKVESSIDEILEEKKEVSEEALSDIHFPLMRNSIYNKETYYTLDKFKITDMSNSDILLSAYLDMYEGNISDSNVISNCSNTYKQFSKDYLELRIKNILSKNLTYTLENFYVPLDSDSNYKGEWIYDSTNSIYIYNGICSSFTSSVVYYNLEQLIKAEYIGDDIVVYYYVGFAKVEDNKYTIYSDPNMENIILNGEFSDLNELINIYSKIDEKQKNIYKYTFKNNLCKYNEYCLYEGEWTDEL